MSADAGTSRRNPTDVAHALVKGTLGGIPFAGGIAGEVFALIVAPPYERRMASWMETIASRVTELERTQPKRFAALATDDTFGSVVIVATQAAIRSRHAEKTMLLANAVGQSAAGCEIDPDLQLTLVQFVDELTVSHISVLASLHRKSPSIAAAKGYPELREAVMADTGIASTPDEFMLLCSELDARALLRVSRSMTTFRDVAEATYRVTEESPESPLIRVTDIGEALLRFVASSGPEKAA